MEADRAIELYARSERRYPPRVRDIGIAYPPRVGAEAHALRVRAGAAYQDVPAERLLTLIPDGYDHPILVVVDKTTVMSAEMPILIMDLNELDEQYGRQLRVVPSELPSIEVNLSLGNMDFFEFADSADDDGVFRGFPG